MTTYPNLMANLFYRLLNGAKKLRVLIGVVIAGIRLLGFAEAATDFCQETAQRALDACQDAAESASSVVLGKWENVSYPAYRTDCRKPLIADFQDALHTSQDG